MTAHTARESTSTLADAINASQDADKLYALAIQALEADEPELARQALERVVSLSPRFAGAWLDLAIASYRSGDSVAAIEHLDYLRTQFNLPPALASQVDYWYRLWQTPGQNPQPRGWQGEIFTAFGYDSNANAGLAVQQIPITLPEGSLILDVDSASLPRADPYWSLGLNAWGPTRAVANGRLNPVLQFNSKQLQHENNFNTIDIQPGLIYEQAANNQGSSQIALFAQHYRLGGQTLFNGLRATTLRHEPLQNCRWTAGTEIESRRHQRVNNLGGLRFSLIGALGCRLANQGNLSATLKIGKDNAYKDRVGGNHRINELILTYDQPINNTQRFQANWQIIKIKDNQGYSPLLEDNAPRQQLSQALDLSLRQAISSRTDIRLNYQYLAQQSNLAIFEQSGYLISFGIAYRFD